MQLVWLECGFLIQTNKKSFPVNMDLLNLICACSDGDDYFAKSQVVYYAVSYVNPK